MLRLMSGIPVDYECDFVCVCVCVCKTHWGGAGPPPHPAIFIIFVRFFSKR